MACPRGLASPALSLRDSGACTPGAEPCTEVHSEKKDNVGLAQAMGVGHARNSASQPHAFQEKPTGRTPVRHQRESPLPAVGRNWKCGKQPRLIPVEDLEKSALSFRAQRSKCVPAGQQHRSGDFHWLSNRNEYSVRELAWPRMRRIWPAGLATPKMRQASFQDIHFLSSSQRSPCEP